MTEYLKKSFTVGGWKAPPKCDHSEPWLDPRGKCVMCGELVKPPEPERPSIHRSVEINRYQTNSRWTQKTRY